MCSVACRLDDRLVRGDIVALVVDEPDFDVIRVAREFALDEVEVLASGVSMRMIGGSSRSSGGSEIIEMSGPATATRGAAAVFAARSRMSKFQNGPPMSTTPVTPFASQTLKVASSRALLRATSCAYGTTALKSAASGRVYRLPDWKKCTWASTRPGISHLPRPSMTLAPCVSSIAVFCSTASIRSPWMMTVESGSSTAAPSRSGCTTVTPVMTVTFSTGFV